MKIYFVESGNGIVKESITTIKSDAEEYIGKLYEMELPRSIKEAVFRDVEHEYRLADAQYHIEGYLLANTGCRAIDDIDEALNDFGINNVDDFLEKCVARFEKIFDCNINENSAWEQAVALAFKEVQNG